MSKMTSKEKLEIRAIDKFCQHIGDTSFSTLGKIKLTKGENYVRRSLVFSWHERFKYVEDEITGREGR